MLPDKEVKARLSEIKQRIVALREELVQNNFGANLDVTYEHLRMAVGKIEQYQNTPEKAGES